MNPKTQVKTIKKGIEVFSDLMELICLEKRRENVDTSSNFWLMEGERGGGKANGDHHRDRQRRATTVVVPVGSTATSTAKLAEADTVVSDHGRR